MPKLSVALLAAEPSGDLQAAAVARVLRRLHPDIELFGVGGLHMRNAGVGLLEDTSLWSSVGLFDAIPKIPAVWKRYHVLREQIRDRRPTLTVFIDAPAINMRMAKYLRFHGLRTAYYFPPSAWAKRDGRLAEIHKKVDAVIATFAYNAEGYRKAGLDIAYFGHPLIDLFQPLGAEEARQQLDLSGNRQVALMPGSRLQEITHVLPVFLETARRLHRYDPGLEFLLPVATPAIRPAVLRQVGKGFPGLHVLDGQAKQALAASQLALICSGSATLEAALLGTPMVLCYRCNWLDYAFGKTLIKLGLIHVPWWGLPNLVLQEDIIPELLQMQVTPGRLMGMALDLLESPVARERQLADLARVRASLGQPGVVEKVGHFISHFAQGMSLREARELASSL